MNARWPNEATHCLARRNARTRARPGLARGLVALALMGTVWFDVNAAGEPPYIPAHNGALLYATHCRTCHTEQVHWREARRAKNWTLLVAEVRRWQANLGLAWSKDDIRDVAHYLNLLYYRYPPAGPRVIANAGNARAAQTP